MNQLPVIFVGPSGSGKSAIIRYLVNHYPNHFQVLKTATTRPFRRVDDTGDYFFVTDEEFKELEQQNKLIETSVCDGYRYGSLTSSAQEIMAAGKIPLKAMDISGALTLDCITVFVKRGVHEMVRSILNRNATDLGTAAAKITQMVMDLQNEEKCDFVLENDRTIEDAANQILDLLNLGLDDAGTREKKITVLRVEPLKPPVVKQISAGLHSLQNQVSGYIEAVYPFDDAVAIVCNEEAKLHGLPLNRALRDQDGHIYDIVAGDFLIVSTAGENFGSLSLDQIVKYTDLFRTPEQFFNIDGNLVVFPFPDVT